MTETKTPTEKASFEPKVVRTVAKSLWLSMKRAEGEKLPEAGSEEAEAAWESDRIKFAQISRNLLRTLERRGATVTLEKSS